MKAHFSTLGAMALLVGCAGGGEKYPSLAIRDVERVQGQYTPVQPSTPEPIRPIASSADIAALLSQARDSHRAFVGAQPQVLRQIQATAGMTEDSKARQAALIAFADLTSLANDTAIPVADLDRFRAEAATTFAPTEAIDAARAEILLLIDEQNKVLDALDRELSK